MKNLKKRLERKREREREADTEEKTRKKKEGKEEKGTVTATCCQAEWVVCGFVHSADISGGGAGCHSHRCFRTIHAVRNTHSHTPRSPREQCSQGTL